jgi:hypothetical protein
MRAILLAITFLAAASCSRETSMPKPPPSPAAPPKPPAPPVAAAPTQITREALRKTLEREGLVLRNPGGWAKRTPWNLTIDDLHSAIEQVDEKTWRFKDPRIEAKFKRVAVIKRPEGQTPLSVFMDTSLQNRPREAREWFIAPRVGEASSGTLLLTVTLPAPLDECSVKLAGFIIAGSEREVEAKLEVSLLVEGAEPKPLYTLDRSSNTDWYDISAQVKGKKQFTLSAYMETTLDKFGTYARVMQCLPGVSREIFSVKGIHFVPAPDANAQWAEAK